MAELNNAPNNAQTPKKIRSRKSTSRVDLTAMVDLAFLLITFFMLTTTLNTPKSMDLTMPDKSGESMPIDENRTLTIAIDKNNKAQCFMGKKADQSKEIALDTKDLRAEIATRKKQVRAYMESKGTPEKDMIVLIQPGKESNYGNLVDILDEMAISEIQSYAIVDDVKKPMP